MTKHKRWLLYDSVLVIAFIALCVLNHAEYWVWVWGLCLYINGYLTGRQA